MTGFIALAVTMVAGAGFAWMRRPPADFDPATYKDHNELMEEVSKEVPGFGGLFLSGHGTVLNIYLTANETDHATQEKRRRRWKNFLT